MIVNGERLARDVIVVAASAGGFEPVRSIARYFPRDLPAGIAVVLHRGVHEDTGLLASILRQDSRLLVSEPHGGELFEHGHLYVAPMDRHLVLRDGRFFRDRGPKENFSRPAANPLFRSAAAGFGPRVLGVILSGGDSDGALGARAIAAAGGITLVQDPREAEDPSMPRRAIELDDVGAVLSLHALLDAIAILAHGNALTV